MKIPDKAQEAFDGNMQDRGAVELPFACPPLFVVNGDPRLEAAGGIHYFGGFACAVEKLQVAAESWENRPFPVPGMTQTETIIKKNQKLKVLAARNIFIAPIGVRQFSSIQSEDGRRQRVAPFTKGARPGIQILCVLGYRDEQKVIQPWAPIMLTASGYQVNNLSDSLSSWTKAIKPLVKKLVPDVEPSKVMNLFWMSIGTFGKTPNFKSVTGSKNQESTITPISSYIPETLDEKMLETLYVSDVIAEWMADLSFQAKDWLQVFKNMEPAKASAAVETESGEPEFSPPPDDDGIPF